MLKTLGSLQVMDFENKMNRSSHKKNSNAILKKIDSFEIEGSKKTEENNEKTEENDENDENDENIDEKLKKLEEINRKVLTFQSMEIEEMYDIRKISNVKLIEEAKNEEKSEEISNEIENEMGKKSKSLRKGFSYSDFEVGVMENNRKITFDQRFESPLKNYKICKRLREKIAKLLDFSMLKSKFEGSFVEVVITCIFFLL